MAHITHERSNIARFSFRSIALIVGVIGTILAFFVDVLYTLAHVLGRISGISSDPVHFWYGLLVVAAGLVGSLIAPLWPVPSAVLLAAGGIGFYFVVGAWAFIASPFLLVAATIAIMNRRVASPPTM